MRLEKASKGAIKYACMNFHYAKSIPVNTHGYSVFNSNNEWCGVILYGTGANNHIAHEFNLSQGQVIELVRVALNGKQETTSMAIAKSLKMIKKDCPLVELIISYADIDQDHIGTIYQACNWYFLGFSMLNKYDDSWVINGKRYHGRTVSNMINRKGGLRDLTRKEFLQKNIDKNATPYITKGKIKYAFCLNPKRQNQIRLLSKPEKAKSNTLTV